MEEIQQKIVEILGEKYKIINSFDNSEEINPDGVIAVGLQNCEKFDHPGCEDFKFSFSISGQTLTDEDLNQNRINQMFYFVLSKNFEELKEIEGVVGVMPQGGGVTSNGETNNFNFSLEVIFCS